jgi:acyl-CoA thioester hydrolase
MLEDFRYIQRFRVPFADIDMLNHVNNAKYVVWAETIRSAYFAEILGEDIRGSRGMILAKLTVDYQRPIAYRAEVAVGCRIARVGRKSFDIVYQVWDETENASAANIVTTLVAYDYATTSSITIPEEWMRKILVYETVPPTTG